MDPGKRREGDSINRSEMSANRVHQSKRRYDEWVCTTRNHGNFRNACEQRLYGDRSSGREMVKGRTLSKVLS